METKTEAPLKEITLRGVLLGIVITVIFTAAQVYLGLKVALTFATSIPAAVISMALLSRFKSASIQENNIVQTIASAAGTLASVIFVIPGLIIIGWWQQVPFWPTFGVCAIGGILGVMYTMPLRRALVTNSDLPYPEGVAAAEVLKVGMESRTGGAEGKLGLMALMVSSLMSAVYALGSAAKLMAEEATAYFKVGTGATSLSGGASLALVGAGHLMGITVGIAMGVGIIIAAGLALPYFTHIYPMAGATLAEHADTIRKTKVRLMGAGVIAVAASFSLAALAGPVLSGLKSALSSATNHEKGVVVPREDRDLPIGLVGLVVIVMLVPAGWLLADFLKTGPLTAIATPLVASGIAFVLLAGLVAAAICGYMAGLIGSSNSPVSGIGILTILGAALVIGAIGRSLVGPETSHALIAFALFVTSMVLAVAVIGNDNLQDLKTGQLVGATPWKQQVALIIGVLAGSAVIPIVLEILYKTNGFVGAPNIGVIGNTPLNAPQANLLTDLATGVIGGKLDWPVIGIGAGIGVVLVLVDLGLKAATKGRLSLPPLGVGLAIYLPTSVTTPVVIGAVLGYIYENMVKDKSWGEAAKRIGILIASGFIVGESLLNVAKSALIYFTDNGNVISDFFAFIPRPNEAMAMIIAIIVGLAISIALLVWAGQMGKKSES